jgi:acetoacetyl-CoA reductase
MVAAVNAQPLTEMLETVPAGRLAMPAEIARDAVFLDADDAGFINGITLSINGA